MRRTRRMAMAALAFGLSLGLSACGRGAGAPDGNVVANALPGGPEASAEPAVAGWFGRWNGPEGTYLEIARHPGGFPRVTLMLKDNLDEPASTYTGRASGAAIRLRRRGQALVIRPGSGAETGFKWLLDKKDCLILVAGQEGYCRD